MTRVLVAEDDPDLALGLRNNLEIEGYDVRVARDGAEALALALRVATRVAGSRPGHAEDRRHARAAASCGSATAGSRC